MVRIKNFQTEDNYFMTKIKELLNLRECKSHQRPTDHYEVQDVPHVSEISAIVQKEALVDHLEDKQHAHTHT